MTRAEELGKPQRNERFLPDFKSVAALLEENDLPAFVTECAKAAVVRPIEKLFAWPFRVTSQRRQQVVTIQMDFVISIDCRNCLTLGRIRLNEQTMRRETTIAGE